MKDYTGNKTSLFACLGASNHSAEERAGYDFYATDPHMAEELCKHVELVNVWECACGAGHLAKVFDKYGLLGRATDIADRGYGESGVDFLLQTEQWNGDIVTNPPYKYAREFVEHALRLVRDGSLVCMFLKLTFLEGQGRRGFFERYPPSNVIVSVKRVQCAKNGDFEKYPLTGSAAAYAWFIWQKGYKGEPILSWCNY